jgi:CDP-diacylglycerol pyrophosphatase
MINDLGSILALILLVIILIIVAFIAGSIVEYRKHLEDKELSDDVFNRCIDLTKENIYLKSQIGSDNLIEDDLESK